MSANLNPCQFFLDFHFFSFYLSWSIQVLALSLIGNPVKIGSGPAAVTGDESRNKATVRKDGKARRVG